MILDSDTATRRPGRWYAGLAVAAAPLAAVVVSYLWWRDRLPDPMPSHWNLEWRVDGTVATATFATGTGAVAAVGLLLALVGVFGSGVRWRSRRLLITVGGAVGAFGAGVWLVTGALALDLTDAYRASAPSWHIPALVVGVALVALAGYVAPGRAPGHEPATGRPPADLPRFEPPPGEPLTWWEQTYPAAALLTLSGVLLVVAILAAVLSPWIGGVILLVALAMAYFLIARVDVDAAGVHVGFGPVGWPYLTVPLSEIESAEVTEVLPVEWGGWGYRFRPGGGRGLILRRGPGVRLVLSGGREFVASTREPRVFAGLVNTLIDRSAR